MIHASLFSGIGGPEVAAARRREDLETRMMAYNQRAGMRFDDMWMFGDCHAIARLKTMFR